MVAALRAFAAKAAAGDGKRSVRVSATQVPPWKPVAAFRPCAACLQHIAGSASVVFGVERLGSETLAYGHALHALCAATLLAAGIDRCPCCLFTRRDDCLAVRERTRREDAKEATT